MPRTNCTGDVGNGRSVPAISPRPHQQNVYPLNEAAKPTLDDARATLDRYGEVVSEVRRRFALLIWRGALDAADSGTSELAAQRAIGIYLAHVAALADLATKLQLECEAALAPDQSLAESAPRSRNNR